MEADGSDTNSDTIDIFQEPKGYYEEEKPATFTDFQLKGGQKLSLRLVGHNPLWGHLLWNAAKVVSNYLEDNAERLVRGKNVLELGAGAGLPSLTCAVSGAKQVVVTDYPDVDLVSNLRYNIGHCDALKEDNIVAEGFLWGSDANQLTSYIAPDVKFDLLILADILFNHSEHTKLVKTVTDLLNKENNATALVFFTPYRPWLLDKDLDFFRIARAAGLTVDKVSEHTMDKVMFDEDPGDELLRRTVFGYRVGWGV